MSNDNAIRSRRRADRRRKPQTPTERMSELVADIMALQDPNGLTPAEATEQAAEDEIPKPLFGGSVIAVILPILALAFIAAGIIYWCLR